MNPFSFVSWLWKAWRGQSVTFALLFASAMVGLSMMSTVKRALSALEMNWLGMLIFPMLLVALLLKAERKWLPDAERRRRIARSLVLGSVGLALLLWLTGVGGSGGAGAVEEREAVRPGQTDQPAAPAAEPAPARSPAHRGPPGK